MRPKDAVNDIKRALGFFKIEKCVIVVLSIRENKFLVLLVFVSSFCMEKRLSKYGDLQGLEKKLSGNDN